MKKKLTRVAGKYQRRYENKGILMYRERENLVNVPAGVLVEVIGEADGGGLLCRYNDFVVRIPEENFAQVRRGRTPAPATRRSREAVEA